MKSPRSLVLVGSLTRPTPYFERANGCGITVFAFDEANASLHCLTEIGGIDNPTYLAIEPRQNLVFAVSEVFGWNEGTVSAYHLDRRTGQLAYINKQPTLGSLPAHVSVDREGRYLFVTNYGHEILDETPRRAVAVLPIRDDGSLGPPVASIQHRGRGPDDVRQGLPHPHSALVDPSNKTLSVPDLGLDEVLHYRFDATTGAVLAAPVNVTRVAAGSGPRHFVYAPDGRHAYVLNELNSTLTAFACGPNDEGWRMLGTVLIVSVGIVHTNLSADIQISPDGRFVYASNRGHDSVAVLRRDIDTGLLSLLECVPTGGRTPRSFAVSPSGSCLIVANQNSDHLQVFARAPSGGMLMISGKATAIGTPMCVKLVQDV